MITKLKHKATRVLAAYNSWHKKSLFPQLQNPIEKLETYTTYYFINGYSPKLQTENQNHIIHIYFFNIVL